MMVGRYLEETNDVEWLRKNIAWLDKELTYWLDEKTVEVTKDGRSYLMAHYQSPSNTPRPESYLEDINTCSVFVDESAKAHCYQGLKSGAESGWDFSSRWFFDEEGGVKTNLSHIDAQRVVPVDLNAILCRAFQDLARFYTLLADGGNAAKWTRRSVTWLDALEAVLYNEEDGIWYDFDLDLGKQRVLFYPSNFAPLWTGSYDVARRDEYGRKAAEYFTRMQISEFKGGIPASLDDNNEQWDLPNAWAPLQEFVILGLWNTGNKRAKHEAKKAAERWVEANMRGFKDQGAMFEKYDATRVGQYGGGGEYEVQRGFGWTNGVVLNLIDIFYTRKVK